MQSAGKVSMLVAVSSPKPPVMMSPAYYAVHRER